MEESNAQKSHGHRPPYLHYPHPHRNPHPHPRLQHSHSHAHPRSHSHLNLNSNFISLYPDVNDVTTFNEIVQHHLDEKIHNKRYHRSCSPEERISWTEPELQAIEIDPFNIDRLYYIERTNDASASYCAFVARMKYRDSWLYVELGGECHCHCSEECDNKIYRGAVSICSNYNCISCTYMGFIYVSRNAKIFMKAVTKKHYPMDNIYQLLIHDNIQVDHQDLRLSTMMYDARRQYLFDRFKFMSNDAQKILDCKSKYALQNYIEETADIATIAVSHATKQAAASSAAAATAARTAAAAGTASQIAAKATAIAAGAVTLAHMSREQCEAYDAYDQEREREREQEREQEMEPTVRSDIPPSLP